MPWGPTQLSSQCVPTVLSLGLKLWGEHKFDLIQSVKFTLEETMKALVARCGGCLTPRPGRFPPGKEIRYPMYRKLGGP
jgi:hypothetical protein